MSTASSRTILRQALHRVRYIFLFSLAFSFFYNLLRLTGPLFMILVYDRVLSSRAEETLIALFVLVAALLVLMALIDYSRRRIMARFGAQFQEAVETGIFQARNRNAYLTNAGPKPAPELNELDRLRSFFHSGSLIAITAQQLRTSERRVYQQATGDSAPFIASRAVELVGLYKRRRLRN